MTITYRAAYWISADKQSSVVLTTPDQDHLNDETLFRMGLQEAAKAGLEIGEGEIVLGNWKE
jgi:hypothetical protein